MMESLKNWTKATAALPWGVAEVFKTKLQLVAEGKTSLAWGRDYSSDGTPCLVNAVANMTEAGGGHGVPSENFPKVVTSFDLVNHDLYTKKVNEELNFVSPLAAEILLKNFGEITKPNIEDNPFEQSYYPEVSDEELMMDWLNSLDSPTPKESKTNEMGSNSRAEL